MIQQKISLPNNSTVVFLGDSHIGHPGFVEDVLDEEIEYITKTPNCYFIGLGDYIEGRPPGHKFYDADSPMNVGEQYTYFFDKIRPIRDKCLGLHIGNHEQGMIQQTTINPVKNFCTDNHIRYLGTIGRTTIHLEEMDKDYTFITAHGAGGGSIGANINKIINWCTTTFSNVDAVIVGHYHKLTASIEATPYVDARGIQRWKELHILLNGAMLETYADGSEGDYVERGLIRPTILGYSEINLNRDSLSIKLHPFNINKVPKRIFDSFPSNLD